MALLQQYGSITMALVEADEVLPELYQWLPWRNVGRVVYAMPNGSRRDDDPVIGMMDNHVLAADAVQSHNTVLMQMADL